MGDARILVVDDEATTRDLLSRILTAAGFDVEEAFSAEEALAMLHRERFDLVTLDVMMPFVDGYDCCRRIREFSDIPVIFVTAKGDPINEVESFNAGADDYIRKPFHVETVLSRVRAVLRRAEDSGRRPVVSGVVNAGPLVLDVLAQEAFLHGRAAGLTGKEFRLLHLLAERLGEIVSQDDIMLNVWGEELDPDSKTLRVHIYRLRRKLDDLGGLGTYLVTKRDRGYLLSPELAGLD